MDAAIYEEIRRLQQQERRAALATIVRIRGSVPSFQTAKMLVRDDGSTLGSIGGGCVEAEVWTAAEEVIREEKSRTLSFDLTDDSLADGGLICGGRVDVFVEPILPQPHMAIFGAGHISMQLSRIATIAGFRTTIVDNRPVYANAERFPEASAIVSESFEAGYKQLTPNENTYVVIVTRGHQEDEDVLRWAIKTNARYIGMIGSKRKIRAITDNLLAEGIPSERLDGVRMPIGLDIGAVTPEEIAVAIVAEAIHMRRAGFKHPLSKKIGVQTVPYPGDRSMRHTLFAMALAALFAGSALAESDYPLIEISLGYGNLGLANGNGTASRHSGFVSQQDINLSRWYGIDNYVGYYNLGSNATAFSNVFGARAIARTPKGFAAYGVAGIGWSHLTLASFGTGTMATTRVGGGFDVPLDKAVKIRVDVSRVSFHTGSSGGSGPSWQSGMSYAGGILLVLQ